MEGDYLAFIYNVFKKKQRAAARYTTLKTDSHGELNWNRVFPSLLAKEKYNKRVNG